MILLKPLLFENINNSTFISVDIQPEYKNAFTFDMFEYVKFLNDNYDNFYKLIFLYNGEETLNMINEYDYKMWYIEYGLREEIVDTSIWYDKGYAFFRYCIDNDIDDDVISNFIRFMYQNNINDSRNMTRENWVKYLKQYRKTDRNSLFKLLKITDDCVTIPDLMDFLRRYNNITLTGGSIGHCLKEVEIACKALNIPYTIYKKFTY